MADSSSQVLLLTDPHLGLEKSEPTQQLHKLRQYLEQNKINPDALIVTGDLSDRGAVDLADLKFAQQQLNMFGMETHCIPGNHDVGNKTGCEEPVNPKALEYWSSVIGPDRFCARFGLWTAIGLNTQIMGSGLPAEIPQWIWLDEQLDLARRDNRPVALCLHMPPYLRQKDEKFDGPSDYWTVDPEPRRELIQRMNHPQIKLIVNGHTHWHWIGQYGSIPWVWPPPVYPFIVEDANFPNSPNTRQFGGAMLIDFQEMRMSYRIIELESSPKSFPWPVEPLG